MCGPTAAWKYEGKSRAVVDGCDDPGLLVCEKCRTSMTVRCGATREDRCQPCGKRHNQRLKRLIGSGFADRPSGFFFNTATAPGADVLPWDESVCNHSPALSCSGKLGCRVERISGAVWNGRAPQVWSWVMTEIRRELKGVDVQFWKCWETQDRGLLHLHAIIWAQGVSERRMKRIWRQVLAKVYDMDGGYRFQWGTQQSCDAIGSKLDVVELVEEMGFTVDQAVEEVQADAERQQLKFIRYGAKYCTKGGKRAATVNRATGEIRIDGQGYRTWSASARWGLRMKQIRQSQRDWAQQAATAGAASTGTAEPGLVGGDAGGGALDSSSDFYAGVSVDDRLPVLSAAQLL